MIRFDSFTKRYRKLVAVESLTFFVGRGEVVALLGPNGSGKTTCLKAAAGLISPTSGGVSIGGRPASDPSARVLLSYLPQKASFPEALTGREVVKFYSSLRGMQPGRAADALRIVSLNGAADYPVGTYSGGMLQRLGLAVAVLPQTPILLLDEPTAALDPEGLGAFYALVELRRAAGEATFFTSHQLGDVERLADRFGMIVEGRLVASFTRAEFNERLAARGLLRIRVDRPMPVVPESLAAIGAQLTVEGGELVIAAPASARAAAIDLVRASGMEVLSLVTEEARLDAIYREFAPHVRDSST